MRKKWIQELIVGQLEGRVERLTDGWAVRVETEDRGARWCTCRTTREAYKTARYGFTAWLEFERNDDDIAELGDRDTVFGRTFVRGVAEW